MRKQTLIVGILMVAAVALCANAYAADGGTTAWDGFWGSVGGFFYNALPWNWGNWMGSGS